MAHIHGHSLVNPAPCFPLSHFLPICQSPLSCPLFYLLGEPAFLIVARIPIHSCPWFAINCSPFATSPTPTHPTEQVTIFMYIDDINIISRPVWYNNKIIIVHAAVHTCLLFCKRLLASFRKHFHLLIKGSVQRKLRWVKNSTNCWVSAWYCGAGHYFIVLFYLYLGFAIFPWCCIAPCAHRQSAARSPRGANL